jgi:hypothetical protein
MNESYIDSVRLLLAITPKVFAPSCFVAYLTGPHRLVHDVLFA